MPWGFYDASDLLELTSGDYAYIGISLLGITFWIIYRNWQNLVFRSFHLILRKDSPRDSSYGVMLKIDAARLMPLSRFLRKLVFKTDYLVSPVKAKMEIKFKSLSQALFTSRVRFTYLSCSRVPRLRSVTKSDNRVIDGFIYKHAEDKSSWRAVVLTIYAT